MNSLSDYSRSQRCYLQAVAGQWAKEIPQPAAYSLDPLGTTANKPITSGGISQPPALNLAAAGKRTVTRPYVAKQGNKVDEAAHIGCPNPKRFVG